MAGTINYIIGTYAGVSGSREQHDNGSNLILQRHMAILCDSLKTTTNITQVTIVKPYIPPTKAVYSDYYDIGHSVSDIEKQGIKVVQLSPQYEFGSSYSQYLHAYTQFPDFDYYIVMEDDWVPFPQHRGFDQTLVGEYEKVGSTGFLSAWCAPHPLTSKWHSAISVGIIGNVSLGKAQQLANGSINLSQSDFSNMFENNDYSSNGSKFMIPFWETTHGCIYEYAEHLSSKYLLVPIQFLYPCYPYVLPNSTSVFSTVPSKEVVEWVSCDLAHIRKIP